jgi:N-carbamoylputrescine amidase
MPKLVKIGLIQMRCSKDPSTNTEVAVRQIREAASSGAQIVCTQELFRFDYFCQTEDYRYIDLAEEVNKKSKLITYFRALADELNIVLVISMFEKRASGIYHNTSAVIDADGSYLGKYRKMHIPDDPHYFEKFYFTPGDLGYKVFHTQYADIGVLICWDQWYPEAARLLGLKGAEIIFIPTAIGYSSLEETTTYSHAWRTVQQGHAVANSCFLAAVNRVGFEPDPSSTGNVGGVGPGGESGINFWGQSFVVDPDGVILKQASVDKEEIVLCSLDLSQVEELKKYFSFPYRDRRIDSYQDLLKLYSD